MRGTLDTAGERIVIASSLAWVADLIAEGAGEALQRGRAPGASIRVEIEAERDPFSTRGWTRLARGAWRNGREVVVENACTAGFDLHVRCSSKGADFTYRWRPPARDRAAAIALRSRFHLLARCVLIQYPALWWAGHQGRLPLHASACVADGWTPLVTAYSGVGRSTLVLEELRAGGQATGDNLAVGDGTTLWGVVEPVRVAEGTGRRMPHGRHEVEMPGRVNALTPDSMVVVERGRAAHPRLERCSPGVAARALTASTYMAGELRRYWAFAATLSAGTGFAPVHPPVMDAASTFALNLPSFYLFLGEKPGPHLSRLVAEAGLAVPA